MLEASGYLGARLTPTGHEVHHIARGEHFTALQSEDMREDMRVDSVSGDAVVELPAADIDPCDYMLFCVKAYDTRDAATELATQLGDRDADPAEIYLPGGSQKGTTPNAYLDLEDETARQLRRYRNSAWKTTNAVFSSRQSNRVSKTSVRRLVKKTAIEAIDRAALVVPASSW